MCGLRTLKQVDSKLNSHLIWVFPLVVICVSCNSGSKTNKMGKIFIQASLIPIAQEVIGATGKF